MIGFAQGEYQHCHDVIKGHASNDHKRRHAGGSINILDKCNAKKGGAASIGSLNKLTLYRRSFPDSGKKRCKSDAKKCCKKTKEHEADIPNLGEISPFPSR